MILVCTTKDAIADGRLDPNNDNEVSQFKNMVRIRMKEELELDLFSLKSLGLLARACVNPRPASRFASLPWSMFGCCQMRLSLRLRNCANPRERYSKF